MTRPRITKAAANKPSRATEGATGVALRHGSPKAPELGYFIEIEGKDGGKQFACAVLEMNSPPGWLVVEIAGGAQMRIPHHRVYSITNRLPQVDEVLTEAAAAVAESNEKVTAVGAPERAAVTREAG